MQFARFIIIKNQVIFFFKFGVSCDVIPIKYIPIKLQKKKIWPNLTFVSLNIIFIKAIRKNIRYEKIDFECFFKIINNALGCFIEVNNVINTIIAATM